MKESTLVHTGNLDVSSQTAKLFKALPKLHSKERERIKVPSNPVLFDVSLCALFN